MLYAKRKTSNRVLAIVASLMLMVAMFPIIALQSAAADIDAMKVTVIDKDTQQPIEGAFVEISSNTADWQYDTVRTSSAANGEATFDAAAIIDSLVAAGLTESQLNVTVTANGYRMYSTTVTVATDKAIDEIQAALTPTVLLSFEINGNGTVMKGNLPIGHEQKIAINKGEAVNFTIAAADNWKLESITVNEKPVDALPTVFSENADIVVTFAPITYSISINVPMSEAQREGAELPDHVNVNIGEKASLKAVAKDGYVIKGVKIGEEEISAPENSTEFSFEVTPTADTSVEVYFARVISVTVQYDNNGKVQVDQQDIASGAGEVSIHTDKDTINIAANPNDGYRVEEVTINDNKDETVTVANGGVYNADIAIKAGERYNIKVVFGLNVYAVTINASENGTVSSVTEVQHGSDVELTFTPDTNYVVSTVLVNGNKVDVKDNKTVISNVQGDITVTATFTLKQYEITLNADHGKFMDDQGNALEGKTRVEHGGELKFKYVADDGYHIVITVDENELQPTNDIYTISNVTSDLTVTTTATDVQAPTLKVNISDENEWKQEKTLTFETSDNSGEDVKVYVSDVDNADYKALDAVTSQKVINNGTYYIYAVDTADNVTKVSVDVTKIDTTAPQVTVQTNADNGTYYQQITYTLTIIEEESGILSVKYGPSENDEDAQEIAPVEGVYTVTVNTNGTYYLFLEDNAGNTFVSNIEVANVDTDAPTISEIKADEEWSSTSNKVTFKAEDNKNVVGVYWSASEGLTSFEGVDTADYDSVNNLYSFTAQSNGTYYVYAVDQAGNIASESVVVDHIDQTKPTVDSINKNTDAVWDNTSITISGIVSDTQETGLATGSSVVRVLYGTSEANRQEADYDATTGKYSFHVSADEFNGIYYVWAVDAVDHVSDAKSIDVKIDTTAPTGVSVQYVQEKEHGFIKQTLNTLSFGLLFKDQVYITINATDNRENVDSGIAKYQYQMVATDGSLNEANWIDVYSVETPVRVKLALEKSDNFQGKVYVRVIDVAGNVTEAFTDTANDGGTVIVKDNATPDDVTCDLNGYADGQWTNQDVVIVLSGANTLSGVQQYEYRIDYIDENKQDRGWTAMPLSSEDQVQMAPDGELPAFVQDKIVITDDTNAVYYFRALSNTGNYSKENSVTVKVQKSLPDNATVEIEDTKKNNDWYVTKPAIEITQPTVSELAAPVTTYYKLWNTTKGETEDQTAAVVFDGNNQPSIANDNDNDNDNDGIYALKIWTVDAAGNVCADIIEREIKVDTTAPTDLNITIDEQSVLPADPTTLVFDTFYKEAVTVKLNADCNISGLAKLQYQKVSSVSQYKTDGAWMDYNAETGIVVTPSEKFIIYFRAEDLAGNVSDAIHSTGIVVDNKLPSGDEIDEVPDIVIQPEDTNKTPSGIYNGDVTVSINVFDPKYQGETGNVQGDFSGLKEITYQVYTTDTDAVISGVLFDASTNLGDITTVDGLVSAWAGQITIPAEQFNSNNVIVAVTAIDNAGNLIGENPRTSFTQEGDIRIDVTAPTIHITYDNNDVDSGKYYDQDRTATITVTERNFNAEDFKVIITASEDGKTPILSEWTTVPGSGNGDDTIHTATITYDTDGDYTFFVEFTDLALWTCGNVADASYNGTLTFAEGTQNATEFTIDKTAPVVSVAYNNNEAENGKYFKAYRTATITIVEHNFPLEDMARIIFTQTANRGGSIPSVSWSHDGDTHVATLVYDRDGDYTFDIAMTDLAGNEAADESYGASVAGQDFIIDTTFEDMISQSGVENGVAYGHDAVVIPTINISDINLQDYNVTLIGVQKDATIDLTEEVTALLEKGTQTVTGIFDIFEVKQDLDGIYTLRITSKDKAGNEDAMEIIFTVNRFGSVYTFEEYLLNLVKDGGAYLQEIDGDLILTEYNADKLVADSLKIEITVDGKPLENVKYTVTPEINDTVAIGSSGWYQYKYTISKENFAADGVYKIFISSEDATGNTPENSNYEDKGVTFRVDSTKSEITSIVGLEEAIINKEEVTVEYTIFDAIGIKKVTVYVNGEVASEITSFDDLNNYTGTFPLKEQSYAQSVRIVVEDLAGNVIDTDDNFQPAFSFNPTVTVSTNFFVRWYANPIAFWGSIGGFVLLVGALIVLLARKSKNKEKEEVTAK